MNAPITIKAGQRLLIKKPYPINPYEVHVIETAGEYAKIQGDSDKRGFWEKIELITPYVIHVLEEPAEPKELDEDHHSIMNRSRISQSLPKDYIDALIKAADPRPSMADAVRTATKKPE